MRHLAPFSVRWPVLFATLLCPIPTPAPAPAPGPVPVAGAGFVRAAVPVQGSPRRLQAADLDGDGDIDLAVESVEGGLSHQLVLVNGGGQAFAPGWTASLATGGFPGVADLDLADVNADGAPDLVLQVPGPSSYLRLNAGDGTFLAPTALPVPNVGVQHALADLDGDSDVDLAYYLHDIIGYVGVSPGDGNGGFAYGPEVPSPPIYDLLHDADLGDVTGDGLADFVLPSQAGLHAFPGAVSGSMFFWKLPSLLLATGGHRDAAVADLDGDALLDIVATRPGTGVVTIVPIEAGGPGVPTSWPAGHVPEALAVGDLDLDGHPDVAVTNARGGTVTVLAGDGAGGLLPGVATKVGRALVDIAAADLDGDGDIDLAVADASAQSVVLLFNRQVP